MTRMLVGMFAAWITVAVLVAGLPNAGAASNVAAPSKISDTSYPSTVGP